MASKPPFFERTCLTLIALWVIGAAGATVFAPVSDVVRAPQAVLVPDDKDPERLAAAQSARISELLGGRQSLTTAMLSGAFDRLGYSLEAVRTGASAVPRLLTTSMPVDIADLRGTESRKALFLATVLPLVLEVNDRIAAKRARIERIREARQAGRKVSAFDRLWLLATSETYKVAAGDMEALLQRVDGVPPSLALAQAAVESGWGTSRFTRKGNALFGQWTWSSSDKGLVPKEREKGKTHRIKIFDRLIDGVEAYVHNLNTHRAYKGFRSLRARARNDGTGPDGYLLAAGLERYSELGKEYVDTLRTVITANGLRELDGAQLRGPLVTAALENR